MYIYTLPDKVIKKSNQELVEIHKNCLTHWLYEKGAKNKTCKKFFTLYDSYVTHSNIRNYFHRPIDLFAKALIQDRLDDISYYTKYKKPKTTKKCHLHKSIKKNKKKS